jgi:hypothetical protein
MQIFPVTGNGATTYNVYYNPNPNQSFANPNTFSQGQLIATYNFEMDGYSVPERRCRVEHGYPGLKLRFLPSKVQFTT